MTNQEFLATTGGKLAAAATIFSTALTTIATDPTLAILMSDYLPGYWRLGAILSLAAAAWFLPRSAAKKDAASDAPAA